MSTLTRQIKKLIPENAWNAIAPTYHYCMAALGAFVYRHPARELRIVAVTGTKGKSTTTELINAILEEAGYRTALTNTLRFKIGKDSRRNLYKMSMPGRFFMQKFLREAVDAKCDFAVLEMTSQGAAQFRHKFIDLDCLVFTNLSPEHIESHGSYEKYVEAKLSIGREMEKGMKKDRTIIVNADDKESEKFLALDIPNKIKYGMGDVSTHILQENATIFTWNNITVHSPLPGLFNLYNMLAAATFAKAFKISGDTVKRALEKVSLVRGRVEKIRLPEKHPLAKKQDFAAVVDYAHTVDSLEQLYRAFPHSRKICVLGNTGGGRDTWKRPEMAKVAEKYCEEIIFTNEDPYDEDPRKIVEDMRNGMKNPTKAEIVMDRREAIRSALLRAQHHDTVLISGKGTDPYIMGSNGSKIPWDDATVVREELEKILAQKK